MSVRRVKIYAAPSAINASVEETVAKIGLEVQSRAFKTANELKTASNHVLRGQRTGRRYKVPGTYGRQRDKKTGRMVNGVYYTASAPGEPPAVRTGAFRMSWQHKTFVDNRRGQDFHVHGVIESGIRVGKSSQYLLGDLLEDGTKRMAPRPYKQRVIDRALPRIERIYNAPYYLG